MPVCGNGILPAVGISALTFGVGEYGAPAISADGRRLVATVSARRQAIVRVATQSSRPAVFEPITDGYTGDIDPCWSPDGTRIVFSSTRSGHRNIWWARADLSKPVFLTKEASIDEGPVYSPDGTQVAFVSDRGGRRGIWVVSADGGTPRLITPAQVLNAVSWSRDGKRLAYSAPVGALPQIETVEVSTGKVTPSADDACRQLAGLVSGRRRDRVRGDDAWHRSVRSIHDR